MMILEFLKEFSALSSAEQKVFLFCVEKCPFPRAYTGDLQYIACGTGLYYQTVRQGLVNISASPLLSCAVKYIRQDVPSPTMVSLDAVLCDGGRQADFDWDAVERALDPDVEPDSAKPLGPRNGAHH